MLPREQILGAPKICSKRTTFGDVGLAVSVACSGMVLVSGAAGTADSVVTFIAMDAAIETTLPTNG
ncbi:hypothetical protein GCM10023114_40700 [Mycolicibacterium sediminis]|uniref:Uncharacterized protein n=1 Tax=Mycolicibacterium sediminis TaxID=1286180 RepID=A0A7I7QVN8_9MYCO|nr:hypothetical protein MSEDJ_44210 [Mycolicibacterium sediminis]